MANILVTGSKGVIGTKLVEILRRKGHKVFGVDLRHHVGEVGYIHEMGTSEHTYSRCDIGEFRQIERVFEVAGPFDYVFNTAAEFGRWNGEDFYEQAWKSNCIGLKNIIRLQEKLGFKLIHFSSSEVYGDVEDVMTEEIMDQKEVKQLNDYAITKWANEMQIANSRKMFKTQTVIVRLFNTYGEGEWYHPYRSVNCKFCYHALHGLPITVYKGHYRTSTYVDDACEALANIVDDFKDGEVYNIGGSEYHDIESVAEFIWKYTGADPSLITYEESEVLTTKMKKTDVSKAKRDLKLENTISLQEGLKKTVDWMKSYYGIKEE